MKSRRFPIGIDDYSYSYFFLDVYLSARLGKEVYRISWLTFEADILFYDGLCYYVVVWN